MAGHLRPPAIFMIQNTKARFLVATAGTTALLFPLKSFAFVPLICDLCTVGVVAGLAVSRYLGVDDSVVGVWIGAVVVALIAMTNAALEKKNVRFRFRDELIALSYVVFTAISLYYANVVGLPRNTFFGSSGIWADKIVVSSLVGAAVLVAASKTYQWLKAKNGGKAHFPFEKVALPLFALAVASAAFHFGTLK